MPPSTEPVDHVLDTVRTAVREKRFDDALRVLQKAVEAEPSRADRYESMGTVCVLAGRHAEAATHFRRVCDLEPEKASGYVNLGAVLNRVGDHEAAVDMLLKGIQRDSNNSAAFYNLGIAYRRLEQRAMAISAYREAIRLDPNLADAHNNLGNLYLETGNVQQAIAQFKRSLEIRPDFDRAQRGLRKAEDARREQSKNAATPFGRLVGAGETQRLKLDEVASELTSEERTEDRDELRTIAQALQTASADVVTHLQSVMVPALEEIQIAVAKGRMSASFTHSRNRFHDALKRLTKLRRQLKARVLRLRAHEELLGTRK